MLNEETSPAIDNTDDPAVAKKDDPAFLYFPTNYRWSMGLLICLSGAPWTGVEIDEVNRVGRALTDKVGDDDAWFEEWARMGDKITARGRDAMRAGHKLTAASCFMRACRYYQTGERFIHPRSQRSMDVYAQSVALFKEAAAIIRRPRIEPVEVPYEGASLPALLVHPDPEATRGRPAPAMVFFDGFDVTKELQYGYGVPDLAARGIGCLIVDGPGNGESVRFRNLPLIAETERYATPVYEYLAGRKEFDPKRIGVMALSLGGYYAPRAAAFDKRIKACIALGGPFNWGANWDNLPELTRAAFRVRSHCKTDDEARKNALTLSLEGVAQNITCPLFIVNGRLDRIVPAKDAERLAKEAKGPVELMMIEDGNHIATNRAYRWRSQSADWMAEKLK
jgi:pimeloyl-ACP methyl ester carboxylesterase